MIQSVNKLFKGLFGKLVSRVRDRRASLETNLKWQKKSGMVYFQIGLSVLEYAVIFYRNYNPNNDYVEQFLSEALSIPID